ncbi:winged helix-turn-helix domain-containing protein [Thalassotalea atypica]|uniref:winged helix-turn-helix domain-containing protein n=1 Tax=Thalassotalea atypica TaxID=2054316 RepID=UPI0025748B3E|nr:winged helix-turn-helix domain-containing protein [Thalassotalea atypica]
MSELIALSTSTYLNSTKSMLIKIDQDVQKEQPLDNLELLVLEYLIQHKDTTVSKDALLALWPTTVVMEHSLARIISSLRKKLEDSTKSPIFIKTVQREGYRYIGDNSLIEQKKPAFSHFSKQYLWLALGALVVSLVIYFLSLVPNTSKIIDSPNYVRQIIADRQTQKQDLSINTEGTLLAYSARKLAQEDWFLRIKDLASGTTFDHIVDSKSVFAPVWLNENTLIFQQWRYDTCSYQTITFSRNDGFSLPKHIADCEPNISANTIAVLDENTVLISDSSVIDFPFSIYQLALDSAKKTMVKQSSGLGNGVYKIISSVDRNYIATLETKDWFDTTISIYSSTDFDKALWQKVLNTPLHSIALSDKYISYINEFGHLVTEAFKLGTSKNSNIAFTSKAYHPVTHGEDFYLFEGIYTASHISLTDLKSNNVISLAPLSNDSVTLTQKVDGNSFIYVSDQSGINQVWLASFDGNQVKQLTTFERSLTIKNIDYDRQNDALVIESQYGVSLYHRNANNDFIESKAIPDAQSPILHNNQLYFTRLHHRGANIFKYDINNDELSLFVKNGYQLVVDNNTYYYSKYFQAGLWQFNQIGDEHKYIDIPQIQLTLETWDVKDNLLTIIDDESFIQTNLITREVEQFDTTRCDSAQLWQPYTCLSYEHVPIANKIVKLKAHR